MNIQIKHFLDEIEKVRVVRDLPHMDPDITPSQIDHCAWWVERALKEGDRIGARAAVNKLVEYLDKEIDFDCDDLPGTIRWHAEMLREAREWDR